jgi:hypothetical protein
MLTGADQADRAAWLRIADPGTGAAAPAGALMVAGPAKAATATATNKEQIGFRMTHPSNRLDTRYTHRLTVGPAGRQEGRDQPWRTTGVSHLRTLGHLSVLSLDAGLGFTCALREPPLPGRAT